jgi:pyruvate formate lyase activating enzyme
MAGWIEKRKAANYGLRTDRIPIAGPSVNSPIYILARGAVVDTIINPSEGFPTRFWRKLDDGRIECTVCPRFCKLHEGQRGLCFVRGTVGGEIVLLSYGRSSGFCIDPIEKKPLNHFLPGTPVFSFGTAGCNLACKFCQNWDISKSREMDSLMDQASPEAIAKAAEELNCRSVAYTYNDPVIFHEYAIDTAKACREHGLKSVAVSAGYQCAEPRAEFYQYMDAANIDLKAFTEDFYHRICGGHLQPVLETLEYIKHETQVWLEITTLLIPDENDSTSELEALTQWVAEKLGPDVPLHFSAFHPDWKMLNKSSTPPATLIEARRIALKNGLRYVYVGNIHYKEGDSTYCHQCGQLLIGRDWYELSEWNLTPQGACRRCGTACAGVFEAAPGDWGAKRMPVGMARRASWT